MEQSEQQGVFSEHFLDMHIYMTSALKKEDIKALGLQLALELIHEKKEKDLITGLKTRTNPGRPDWDKVNLLMRKTVLYQDPRSVLEREERGRHE